MVTESHAPAVRAVPPPRAEDGAGGPDLLPPAVRAGLLEAIWAELGTALAVVDADLRVVMANPTARARLRLYGLAVGDRMPLGRTCLPGTLRPLPLADHPISRALAGEPVHRQELTHIAPDGVETGRAMMTAHPVPLPSGPGALCAWSDVTEQRRAEEATQVVTARLSRLLDGAQDYAIHMLDRDGLVTSWSSSASRVLGWEEADVIGRSYATFFPEAERAAGAPQRILAEAAERGRAETEGLRVRRDGSTFWAHGSITTMREDGEIVGFVKVTHDVSRQREDRQSIERLNRELRELNEELERRVAERTAQLEQHAAELTATNQELEAFSYSVSHDLRTPLRAMNGYAHILLDEHADRIGDEGRHYLTKIQDNARRMGSLIDALLAFSRLQRQALVAGPVDMTATVRRCWDALEPLRGDWQVELVLGELPPARGDARLLEQVWLNLLDNALKYTATTSPARVEVTAAERDGVVRYQVRDDGVGFDMRYAHKLFQVFQRLHSAEEFAGTGIGLALVARIVSRHGGRVQAEGAPGAGATFSFSLWETA